MSKVPKKTQDGNVNAIQKLSDIVPELAYFDTAKKQVSHSLFLTKARITARYSREKKLSKDKKSKIKSLFLAEYTRATTYMRDFLLGLPDLSRDEKNYWQKKLTEFYGKIKDLLFESLDNNISSQHKFNELVREELCINQGLAFDAGSYQGCGTIDKKTRVVKFPEPAEKRQVKIQLNESQKSLPPSDYLHKISKQINGFIVGCPANKNKFCKHIKKVIQKVEEYGKYLRTEWQRAKELGLTQWDENKDKEKWFWWTAYTNDRMEGEGVYFADDECGVQFYIEGKPEPDPLGYLSSMIWGCVGQDYEGLELLDYQFVLLAIIHDAQNWQAGRKRIYFNRLEKGTLSGRLLKSAWHHLKRFQNSYEFKDVQDTIDTALRAVTAELDAETGQKAEGSKIMITAKISKENWEAIRSEYDISKKDFGKKINFVSDSFKKKIIFRDVEHAFVLASQGFSKPALILAGGVIEELLRLYLEHKNIKPKNKRFVDYTKACEDNGLLKRGVSRLSDSIRDFRNLVHLDNEKTKRHTVSKATAKGAVSSILTIANDFQ